MIRLNAIQGIMVGKSSSFIALVGFFLTTSFQLVRAQEISNDAKVDLSFVEYLISNAESEDALLVLKQAIKKGDFEVSQTDSINYYMAWSYYSLKQLDSSIFYFERVSSNFELYDKCKFYESFEHIYLYQNKQANEKLAKLQPKDASLEELKRFQLAANALLQRDFLAFDSISSSFDYSNFSSVTEQKALFNYAKELKKNKKKSPFIGGLLSAIVPGSGKFYAGYRGQAISSMIPTFIFAAASAESYYRAGPKSAQFIAAASLFSLFYIGNIWGSAISVRTFYEHRNNEIHNNIMLDLHIPLRRIFSN